MATNVTICADDHGIYAELGTVFIDGGSVTIEAAYSGIFSNKVSIGTPPFYSVERSVHPGPWVNINASKIGIFTQYLSVYTGTVSVRGKQAAIILQKELLLGFNPTVQVPAAYEVDGTIWDTENACPAQLVFISEKECQYADTYCSTVTHHWQPCLDSDCQLHDTPFFFRGYGEHLDEDKDGFCDICACKKQEGQFDVYVGGAGLTDGDYLSLTGEITENRPKGGYACFRDGVLTLHDYQYSGAGYQHDAEEAQYNYCSAIYSNTELIVVLEGENTLNLTKEYGACVNGPSVSVSGEGKLKMVGWNGIWASNDDVDISGGDVVIHAESNGIYAEYDGIVSDGEVSILSSGEEATGIYTYYGGVTVSGGSVTVTADDDGIYAYGGNVDISGGSVTVNTDDDGIYAYSGNVDISGGTVAIDAYCDGVYAECGDVSISGGNVTIEANDDGIFTYDGNVTIDDGKVSITTSNDGIYAEYDVIITGGQTTVNSSRYGIFAYDEMYISDSHASVEVSSYNNCALYAEHGLYIDDSLAIHEPKGGYVDECTVYDSNGEPAYDVYISCEDIQDAAVVVAGVGLKNGDYLGNDTFVTSAKAPKDGGYAYYKDGVLTLHDYRYEGAGYLYKLGEEEYTNFSVIYSNDDIALVLEGENTLRQTEEYGVCITAPSVAISGEGCLDLVGDYGIYAYEGDISISDGEVSVTAVEDSIFADFGDVTVSDGSVVIVGYGCGIYSGEGNVNVSGGTVNITSFYSDGIYISNGNIIISDGNVTIHASDDGMRTDCGDVTISGGSVDINAVYAGIASENIVISGGHIKSVVNSNSREKFALLSFGDLTLSENMNVIAPRDGQVQTESWDDGYGEYTTIIDANGLTALEVELVATYTVSWIVDDQVFAQTVHKQGETIAVPDDTPVKEAGSCVTYTFSHWKSEANYVTMPAQNITFTAVFAESGEHAWQCESYQWSEAGCQVSLTCTVCGHTKQETVIFTVENGVLTMNYIPTDLSLMIAGYNSDQMMAVQLADIVASEVTIDSSILNCESIRVYFLNDEYVPLCNALTVK